MLSNDLFFFFFWSIRKGFDKPCWDCSHLLVALIQCPETEVAGLPTQILLSSELEGRRSEFELWFFLPVALRLWMNHFLLLAVPPLTPHLGNYKFELANTDSPFTLLTRRQHKYSTTIFQLRHRGLHPQLEAMLVKNWKVPIQDKLRVFSLSLKMYGWIHLASEYTVHDLIKYSVC